MTQLIEIQGVKGIATTVEDTPHLIFTEITDWLISVSLQYLLFYAFEWVFHYDLDLE